MNGTPPEHNKRAVKVNTDYGQIPFVYQELLLPAGIGVYGRSFLSTENTTWSGLLATWERATRWSLPRSRCRL